MIDLSNLTQFSNAGIILVVGSLIIFTIGFTFILPILLKSEKFRFNLSYNLGKLKQHKSYSIGALVVILIILAGGYFWYLTTQPIVLSSEDFSKRESASLEAVKNSTPYEIFKNGDLLLVDLRSNEAFLKSHLTNSFNVSAENIAQETILNVMEDKKVAVYSDNSGIDQAKETASFIKREITTNKVYVIEDGYEGMEDIGFVLVAGNQYEPIPIENEKN